MPSAAMTIDGAEVLDPDLFDPDPVDPVLFDPDVAGGDVGAVIVALEKERARLDAVLCRALGHFDATGAYEADHAVSAKAWLKHHAHMTGPQAAVRLRVARCLRRFPLLAAALAAAEITFDQVRMMLARLNPMTEQAFTDDQQTLIDAARTVHIDDLGRVLDVWAAHADPNGTQPDDPDTDSVHLNQGLDHRHHLHANLNPTAGDLLARALDNAETQLGPMHDRHGHPLEAATRRAHALTEIARHYLGCAETPTTVRPCVTVLTNPTDLALGLPAETDRGTWLSGDHVRRFLCDATIQAALTDPAGNLLDTYAKRAFPDAALRRSVLARDRHCQYPGCRRPAHQCEIHHLTPRSKGGATTGANLGPFCDRHHHQIHTHHWTTHRNPDGSITITDQHGQPIHNHSRWNPD